MHHLTDIFFFLSKSECYNTYLKMTRGSWYGSESSSACRSASVTMCVYPVAHDKDQSIFDNLYNPREFLTAIVLVHLFQ